MSFNGLAGFGVLQPEDLALLTAVYDDILAVRGLGQPEDNTRLAGRLLFLFSTGMRDRELLHHAALRSA